MLRTLLEQLHAAGIVTDDLAVPDDFSDLELVYHGLCKLPESGAKRRRIDFLCVPWESRGAALLYYTVSVFLTLTYISLFNFAYRVTTSQVSVLSRTMYHTLTQPSSTVQ